MTSLLSLMDAMQGGNVQEIAAASTRHPGLFLLMTPRSSAHREAESFLPCSSLYYCPVREWKGSRDPKYKLVPHGQHHKPGDHPGAPPEHAVEADGIISGQENKTFFWLELGKKGGGWRGTLPLLPSILVNWKGLSPDSCWYFLMEISSIDRDTDGV